MLPAPSAPPPAGSPRLEPGSRTSRKIVGTCICTTRANTELFDRLDNLSVGRKLCVCVADLDDEAEDDDAGRADHGAEPGEGRQLFGGVTVDGARLCDAHYHHV